MALACALGMATAPVIAQEELDVLTAPSDRMLYDYLLRCAQAHFDARRAAVAALKTPEAIRRRQEDLRARFVRSLGGFPKRTPLNARVVGRQRRDGYRVEKVIFESRPDHHVTAALYLPEGEGPHPGVLLPCGHSANGKAAEPYQRASILLAKNGLAVLCYDPIGQGERIQLLDERGKPAIAGSTNEHSLVGVGALLVGQNVATYRIWDGIRAMDYLASRPEVDPDRLGCTGNSGGGTLTAYLMVLDDRIKVAVPSCYITSLERLFATIGPQDAEQNITGQVAFGMEHADYVTMRAPRPTLLSVGTRDFFDIDGAWDSYREAKLIYGRLGYGERVDLFESDEPHGFTRPRREAATRWLRRWLLGIDDAPTEGDFPIASDAELQCTESGQVLTDFRGQSAFDLNAARARELAAERDRRRSGAAPSGLLEEVERRIALKARTPDVPPIREVGEVRQPGRRVRKLVFPTEPGIEVPALLVTPDEPAEGGAPLIVAIGHDRAAAFEPGGLVARWTGKGHAVLLVDPRGMGETAPTPRYHKTRDFGPDSQEAFLALHLDRPLLGQRVFDVLRVLDALVDRTRDGVHLVGIGVGGPIALHAAALDPRIGQLTLERSILSWTEVAETPRARDQLSNVVPGALLAYDLPDLAASLAPRPLTIESPVAPTQQPASKAALDEQCDPVRRAYQAKGAGDKLTIRPAS
ncbi:MAG: acetylxylan esterase [Isosphaeraceae bacterium]|nr:acetylxylan esterase [Isosphaeraceae bacterium]